jgi:hypothetical protein
MSSKAIKDRIIGWIGPTAVFAAPPLADFIALGSDAIPEVIDIFKNPDEIPQVREFGTNVYLPVLVRLLDHHARQGSNVAGHALFDIANARILTWGQYGEQARSLAYELAQKILDERKAS